MELVVVVSNTNGHVHLAFMARWLPLPLLCSYWLWLTDTTSWSPPSHRAKTPSAALSPLGPWIIMRMMMAVLLLSFGIWPTSFPEVLKALYRHCLIIPHNTSLERRWEQRFDFYFTERRSWDPEQGRGLSKVTRRNWAEVGRRSEGL